MDNYLTVFNAINVNSIVLHSRNCYIHQSTWKTTKNSSISPLLEWFWNINVNEIRRQFFTYLILLQRPRRGSLRPHRWEPGKDLGTVSYSFLIDFLYSIFRTERKQFMILYFVSLWNTSLRVLANRFHFNCAICQISHNQVNLKIKTNRFSYMDAVRSRAQFCADNHCSGRGKCVRIVEPLKWVWSKKIKDQLLVGK